MVIIMIDFLLNTRVREYRPGHMELDYLYLYGLYLG